MKSLTLFFLLFLAACSSLPYSQEMLPDGKTWEVRAHRIACEPEECKAKMKETIGARGRLLCGEQPFRVITCDIKIKKQLGAKAACLLRCGEKPSVAKDGNDEFTL